MLDSTAIFPEPANHTSAFWRNLTKVWTGLGTGTGEWCTVLAISPLLQTLSGDDLSRDTWTRVDNVASLFDNQSSAIDLAMLRPGPDVGKTGTSSLPSSRSFQDHRPTFATYLDFGCRRFVSDPSAELPRCRARVLPNDGGLPPVRLRFFVAGSSASANIFSHASIASFLFAVDFAFGEVDTPHNSLHQSSTSLPGLSLPTASRAIPCSSDKSSPSLQPRSFGRNNFVIRGKRSS